jgi:hypothetical protein
VVLEEAKATALYWRQRAMYAERLLDERRDRAANAPTEPPAKPAVPVEPGPLAAITERIDRHEAALRELTKINPLAFTSVLWALEGKNP